MLPSGSAPSVVVYWQFDAQSVGRRVGRDLNGNAGESAGSTK